MALGNSYDNNKKQYQPTVYSNYGMANSESTVDASALSFSFWNSMLKIAISPKKANTGDQVEYDHDNAIGAYLNHTKARMLYNEIDLFLKDPATYNSSGVLSNNKLITISNGAEFGTPGMFIIIRQVNLETLDVESSYAYQCKQEFYYSIRNFDDKSKDFNKVTEDYNNIEATQILEVLKTYVKSMTGAIAYSVIDQEKYNYSRMTTKLEAIAEKLGVDLGGKSGGNSYNKKSSNSAFDKAASKNYSSASLEDLEGME